MRIVAISGSLRKASFNRQFSLLSPRWRQSAWRSRSSRSREIPLFNQDVEAEGTPEAVQRLRDAIAAADGVLVATPEYNAGMPGVLKNTIDWLSRPPGKSVLGGKPTALVGVTPGQLGTARAQGQLRAAFEFVAAPVMPSPQVFVGQARDKFDADGRLTDDKTRAYLRTFMAAFARWVARNAPE